jgi:hypothetical protein
MAIINISDNKTARLLILEKVYQLLNERGENDEIIELKLENLFKLNDDDYYIEHDLFWKIISNEMLLHMITEKIEINDKNDDLQEEFSAKKIGNVLVCRPVKKSSKYCIASFFAKTNRKNTIREEIKRINTPKPEKEEQKNYEEKPENNTSKIKPYFLVDSDKGYLKLNKHSNKIIIGGKDTRKFRLLRFLLDPINSARTIESIFEAIKLPRDKKDSALNSYNSIQVFIRKKDLIDYQIKEIQKIKELQGKIKFDFDEIQKTYRLTIF